MRVIALVSAVTAMVHTGHGASFRKPTASWESSCNALWDALFEISQPEGCNEFALQRAINETCATSPKKVGSGIDAFHFLEEFVMGYEDEDVRECVQSAWSTLVNPSDLTFDSCVSAWEPMMLVFFPNACDVETSREIAVASCADNIDEDSIPDSECLNEFEDFLEDLSGRETHLCERKIEQNLGVIVPSCDANATSALSEMLCKEDTVAKYLQGEASEYDVAATIVKVASGLSKPGFDVCKKEVLEYFVHQTEIGNCDDVLSQRFDGLKDHCSNSTFPHVVNGICQSNSAKTDFSYFNVTAVVDAVMDNVPGSLIDAVDKCANAVLSSMTG